MSRHHRAAGLVLSCLALAGCGSASSRPHPSSGDIFTGMTATTAAPAAGRSGAGSTAPATATTTSSSTAAAMTTIASGGGGLSTTTGVGEAYELGPLGYGSDVTAASAAISACGQFASDNPATGAYAPGRVIFRYAQGSVPEDVTLSLDQILDEAEVYAGDSGTTSGNTGLMAFQNSDGSWSCGGEGDPDEIDLQLQPGTTTVYNFWLIVPQVLTNQQPRLQTAVKDGFVFNPGIGFGDSLPYHYDAAGAQSYKCSFGTVVLPFASGPSVTAGQEGRCVRVG